MAIRSHFLIFFFFTMKKYTANVLKNNLSYVLTSAKCTLPQRKSLKEIATGLLKEGTPFLRQLAQDEGKTAKKQSEKYGKHLGNVDITEAVDDFALRKFASVITEYTVMGYDLGDIAKPSAQKMEKIHEVFDGSKREKANGYTLHGVGGADFLLALRLHDHETEFLPQVRKQILERIMKRIGTKGIWAFDRGNDDGGLFRDMNEKQAKFIVRLKKNRDVILCSNGQVRKSDELKCGRYEVFIRDEHGKVDTKNKYLLVIRKHLKKKHQPIRLLCSINLKKFSNKQLVIFYLERWGIENNYKRIKSLYKLEEIRIIKWKRLKSLIALIQFVALLSATLYKKIEKATCFLTTEIKTSYRKFLKSKSRTYNLHSFGVFLKDIFLPITKHAQIPRRQLQPSLFYYSQRKLGMS
jgi:hypothetical protein